MGKKKTKRQIKREQREHDAEARALATAVFEAKRRKYRIAAILVPIVTLAISIGVYMATDDKQLAGLIGMVGVSIFVPLGLGAVGSEVTPRDRTRAGSIDFGNKR
ncbi:MAG TPA: hypothetical protein ENK57_16140 [Polyangiaceae bacterium]|nr:hypothetical protein [Polyangiaceae bacterium]